MPGQCSRLLVGLAIVAGMAGAALAEDGPRVVATYFHRELRCQTCLQIESLARYDLTDVMANDVASGQLAWRLVNYEEAGNAHFAEEFELEGPSLVIAIEYGGEVVKWVRLDRVWDLYGDVEAFDEYVLGTAEDFLAAASEIAAGRDQPSSHKGP